MYVFSRSSPWCVRSIDAPPQVATKVVEMSSDAAAKLWEDSINQRLFDLVHSPHNHDKLGGILAIGARLSL
jgi:hypothetical protein